MNEPLLAQPTSEETPAEAPSLDVAQPTEMFLSDREFDRQFLNLKKAIERKEWTPVSTRLLELQKERPDLLVNIEGIISSVPVAATHLVEALPREGKAVYLRLAEPVAREKFKEALRSSDFPSILNVARYYRQTPAADEALRLIARHSIDRGEWEEATLISQRIKTVNSTRVVEQLTKAHEQLQKDLRNERTPPEYLKREFPSKIAAWEFFAEQRPEVLKSIESTYQDLRLNGFAPYLSLSLTQLPKGMIWSGPAQRVALDLATGKQTWHRPVPGYASTWMQNPGDLGDINRKRLFGISSARRAFSDSVISKTNGDGTRLYLIEPIPLDDPVAKPITDGMEAIPANRVVCLDSRTGEAVWVFNGTPAGEVSFAGPPAVFGDRLYVLGVTQASGLMQMFVLDSPTGKSLQSVELTAPRMKLESERAHFRHAARIEIDGGQLLCATEEGVILSIDPLFSEINWATRLSLPASQLAPAKPLEVQGIGTGFENWETWQEIYLHPGKEHLIFAAPGSGGFAVIQRTTGQLLWQYPRGRAVHLLFAEDHSLVALIEKGSAIGIDLSSGKQKWKASIPQPAGRGVVAGNSYLFPIHEQDVARLDLADGQVHLCDLAAHSNVDGDEQLISRVRPRSFTVSSGELFEYGVNFVRKLQPPQQAQFDLARLSPLERALSLIERGKKQQAGIELRKLVSDPESTQASAIRILLRHLLEEGFLREPANESRELLRSEIESLVQTPLERAAWRQSRAKESLMAKEWGTFAHLWLNCPQEELTAFVPLDEGDARCRLDRWFQSQASLSVAPSEGKPSGLSHPLDDAVRKLIRQPGIDSPSEQKRMVLCLGETSWGNEWTLRLPLEFDDQQDFVERQLRLLRIASNNDPRLAASACEQLVRLYSQQKEWLDVQRWLTRLQAFPPQTVLASGKKTVQDVVDEVSANVSQSLSEIPALRAWETKSPSVNIKTSREKSVLFLPLPVQVQGPGLWNRLNVEVDSPASEAIRFNGSSWNRPWGTTIRLRERNLQLVPGQTHFWGFEQFCLVQSANEIIGLCPISLKGGTSSRKLWPRQKKEAIDTLGPRERPAMNPQMLATRHRPGFAGGPGQWIDEYGHFISSVGPVRAGYFCIQQMGMLVAFETASGQECWRRYDLPKRAWVGGDDEQVIVISPTEEKIRRFNAVDGTLIEERAWTRSLDELIRADGLRLLHVSGDKVFDRFDDSDASDDDFSEKEPDSAEATLQLPVFLESVNAADHSPVWKREFPHGTLPFSVDEKKIGILLPDGTMQFLRIDDGTIIHERIIPMPEKVERIVCSVTEKDFLIVLSANSSVLEFGEEKEMLAGYRRPFLNGHAWCFQRQTCELLWERKLPEGVMRLDQPVDLPIFVMIGRPDSIRVAPEPLLEDEEKKDPEEELSEYEFFQPPGVILRCFDRRTGELIQELAKERVHYAITGNRALQTIAVTTMKTRLELDFSGNMENSAPIPDDGPPSSVDSPK